MKTVITYAARAGLVLTILPAFLFLLGAIELAAVKGAMIAGMVLWFVGAPLVQRFHDR